MVTFRKGKKAVAEKPHGGLFGKKLLYRHQDNLDDGTKSSLFRRKAAHEVRTPPDTPEGEASPPPHLSEVTVRSRTQSLSARTGGKIPDTNLLDENTIISELTDPGAYPHLEKSRDPPGASSTWPAPSEPAATMLEHLQKQEPEGHVPASPSELEESIITRVLGLVERTCFSPLIPTPDPRESVKRSLSFAPEWGMAPSADDPSILDGFTTAYDTKTNGVTTNMTSMYDTTEGAESSFYALSSTKNTTEEVDELDENLGEGEEQAPNLSTSLVDQGSSLADTRESELPSAENRNQEVETRHSQITPPVTEMGKDPPAAGEDAQAFKDLESFEMVLEERDLGNSGSRRQWNGQEPKPVAIRGWMGNFRKEKEGSAKEEFKVQSTKREEAADPMKRRADQEAAKTRAALPFSKLALFGSAAKPAVKNIAAKPNVPKRTEPAEEEKKEEDEVALLGLMTDDQQPLLPIQAPPPPPPRTATNATVQGVEQIPASGAPIADKVMSTSNTALPTWATKRAQTIQQNKHLHKQGRYQIFLRALRNSKKEQQAKEVQDGDDKNGSPNRVRVPGVQTPDRYISSRDLIGEECDGEIRPTSPIEGVGAEAVPADSKVADPITTGSLESKHQHQSKLDEKQQKGKKPKSTTTEQTRSAAQTIVDQGKPEVKTEIGADLKRTGSATLLAKNLETAKLEKKITQSTAEKPLWKAVVDKNTGRTYYYHKITRQTTWTRPTEGDLITRKSKKKKPRRDGEADVKLDGSASAKKEAEDNQGKQKVIEKSAPKTDSETNTARTVGTILEGRDTPVATSDEQPLTAEKPIKMEKRTDSNPFDEPLTTSSKKSDAGSSIVEEAVQLQDGGQEGFPNKVVEKAEVDAVSPGANIKKSEKASQERASEKQAAQNVESEQKASTKPEPRFRSPFLMRAPEKKKEATKVNEDVKTVTRGSHMSRPSTTPEQQDRSVASELTPAPTESRATASVASSKDDSRAVATENASVEKKSAEILSASPKAVDSDYVVASNSDRKSVVDVESNASDSKWRGPMSALNEVNFEEDEPVREENRHERQPSLAEQLIQAVADMRLSPTFEEIINPEASEVLTPVRKHSLKDRTRTPASITSGFSGKVSEITPLIRNTASSKPSGQTIGRVEEGASYATSLSSRNLPAPESMKGSPHRGSRRVPSTIPVPRSRELNVEEFSFDRIKAETFDTKNVTRTSRKPPPIPRQYQRPTPAPYEPTKFLADSDSGEYYSDSVSALSEADNDFLEHPDAPDFARRRALDAAIARKDWKLAAALSEDLRTKRAPNPLSQGPVVHPPSLNVNPSRNKPQREWTQTELDRFISENDWDAVASYIAQVGKEKNSTTSGSITTSCHLDVLEEEDDTRPMDEPETKPARRGLLRVGFSSRSLPEKKLPYALDARHPSETDSSSSSPMKKFGARSQLQHSDLHSVSSWESSSSNSSYDSDAYSSEASYESEDEPPPSYHHQPHTSGRRKEFRC